MNKYELVVILNPNLEDDDLKSEFETVQGYVTKFGGTIEKIDEWGKRKLAYEVKKMTEGIYYFITFLAPGTAPAEIESRLRIRENILRFLIIRQDD